MSRNMFLAIIILILVFVALIFLSQRGTNTQNGFVSPTPIEGTIDSTTPSAMEVTPTTQTADPSLSPANVVTISPASE